MRGKVGQVAAKRAAAIMKVKPPFFLFLIQNEYRNARNFFTLNQINTLLKTNTTLSADQQLYLLGIRVLSHVFSETFSNSSHLAHVTLSVSHQFFLALGLTLPPQLFHPSLCRLQTNGKWFLFLLSECCQNSENRTLRMTTCMCKVSV